MAEEQWRKPKPTLHEYRVLIGKIKARETVADKFMTKGEQAKLGLAREMIENSFRLYKEAHGLIEDDKA